MLKEIARYGKFKTRDKPIEKENVTTKGKPKKLSDIFNPWEIYDYDIDFNKEVCEDESDIFEQ